MHMNIVKLIEQKTKVISLQYGIGEITGLFSLYDGVDDYLEIKYSVDDKTRYMCIEYSSDVRLISSKESIELALNEMWNDLKAFPVLGEFNEKQTSFGDKNVLFIIKRIVGLIRNNNLSVKDDVLLHSSINSLIQEVEEVYCVDYKCARGIVADYMKCA